jgi:hypothetical protein
MPEFGKSGLFASTSRRGRIIRDGGVSAPLRSPHVLLGQSFFALPLFTAKLLNKPMILGSFCRN